MNMSLLQKKTDTNRSLAAIFLVGLFSLTFLVFKPSAASAACQPPLGGSVTSTALSAQTIQVSLVSSSAGTCINWSLAYSTDNVTRTVVNISTATTTPTYTFTGLATNTPYYLAVAETDGAGNTSTYRTSTARYTLADTPGTSLLQAYGLHTLTLKINSSTNPATTSYVIKMTTGVSPVYLQDDHTLAASIATFKYTQLGPVSGTTTINLDINTLYDFSVAAVNGDGVTTTFASAGSGYTLASTPSTTAVSAGGNSLTFTWTGDATDYYAEDLTSGANSGFISGKSYTVNGLNCATTHSFDVEGRNGSQTETSFTGSISGTTSNCGTAIAVPTIPAMPAIPAVPGVNPATPATPAIPGRGVSVFIHTLAPGSRGGEVKALQQKLRELGYFTYPTNTGLFGSITRAAVVAFQKDHGLKPYPGWVGPATRAALNIL